VSTIRGGACRGASHCRIEARGQGLQSPRPAGPRIRGACTGVAIVNRRSASGGESLIRPGTRHLDTRGVSLPPPIGHRPRRTQPNLALRGAARSARHQGEEDQLGSPRGGLAHRHRPEEKELPSIPCCSTTCDNTLSPPYPVGGSASQIVSPGSPVGEYPPRKKTPKSTHARRRPGEGAPSDKHELCDRQFTCPRRWSRGATHASPSYPVRSPRTLGKPSSDTLKGPSENPPQIPSKDPRKTLFRHPQRTLGKPSPQGPRGP